MQVDAGQFLRFLANQGDGTFSQAGAQRISFRGTPASFVVADLDLDGVPDIAAASPRPRSGVVTVVHLGEVPTSLDCDGNGVPDECDEDFADCDQNGISDSCEADCDGDGRIDACEIGSDFSMDCNGDLIPDECQVALLAEADCNDNGVLDGCEGDCNLNGTPDDCDVANGTSLDENGDGFPDECEADRRFRSEIVPARDDDRSGDALASLPWVVRLYTYGLEDDEPGAQGWSLGLETRGCLVVGATHDGTAADEIGNSPEGLVDGGFWLLREFHSRDPARVSGVNSAVVLSFTLPVTLRPGDSPHVLLRGRATLSTPPANECGECTLRVVDSPLGYAGGVVSAATWNGMSLHVEPSVALFSFCGTPFRRGDAVDDGVLDISDAVAVLGSLFLGTVAPSCLEAADSDNDGRLSIGDGIFVLSFLFATGDAPPAPGPSPGECGLDPAAPAGFLSCESYAACDA